MLYNKQEENSSLQTMSHVCKVGQIGSAEEVHKIHDGCF